MRHWIFVPLLLATACSPGGNQTAPGGNEQQEEASALEAGEWEITSEVTSFRSTDKSPPAVRAAVGDKATSKACLMPAEIKNPPAGFFGGDGYSCTYRSNYFNEGRMSLELQCSKKGVTGSIPMSVQGSFTSKSFEATAETQTYLPGEGDFKMTRKLSGSRTNQACSAPAPDAAKL